MTHHTTPPSLAPILSPHGHLLLAVEEDAPPLDSRLVERLEAAFGRGSGHGLLHLGSSTIGTALPPDLAALRRHRAAQEMARLQKKGHRVSPVVIRGRTIAATFWGKAWCENLERYSDFANRLPRGRTYIRNGSVCDLQIAPGEAKAVVSGSELFKVTRSKRLATPSRPGPAASTAPATGKAARAASARPAPEPASRKARGPEGQTRRIGRALRVHPAVR